ncbi:iron chelate uptake ABC transporter family permease subunit [uncultured Thalassospira sp.]|uniref:iron chelate uptake ABC transporter family permease subunit n=1 Tax=uncultured Thalassospira sp. TaxID=404382 RepID=UPI0025899D84|nr:iron chelate uptake ABC transporter family permease subunit [uncultured Thalassospira sp.]
MSRTKTIRRRIGPGRVLMILLCLACLSAIGFMTIGARGNWAFILEFRGTKLLALLLVAYAVSVSTVLFQTVTSNRILTPSIMGIDALYVLLQTVLIFVFGAQAISALDPQIKFLIEAGCLTVFALILYRFLFFGVFRDVHLLLLSGLFFGLLFRSVSGLLQRIIDPNDFVVLQDSLFASFNSVDKSLFGASVVVIVLVSAIGAKIFSRFDVMLLGRGSAISLGVNYTRTAVIILALASVLVAVSTALVGPVTFFGLLVANLAYIVLPGAKHKHILPGSVLIAFICLSSGQLVLEKLFDFNTALAILIEFAGGLFFIGLILRRGIR